MWAESRSRRILELVEGQSDTSLLMEWGPDLLGTLDAHGTRRRNGRRAQAHQQGIFRCAAPQDRRDRAGPGPHHRAAPRRAGRGFQSLFVGRAGLDDRKTRRPRCSGLAALPRDADYRYYLDSAVEVWAKADPRAALAWLSTRRPAKMSISGLRILKAASKPPPRPTRRPRSPPPSPCRTPMPAMPPSARSWPAAKCRRGRFRICWHPARC